MGPRNIDIDILLYGNKVEKDLIIPHPKLLRKKLCPYSFDGVIA
ncbi:MAG: 2-amino-4-hydroxy-6-hydroxymethyldihydropteridine diphosphokinase [Saprospiraceae bacterium]|nr:2-amino-4-hydroxy-6-hydroxymethyldihydropteridine diphosphokinase [Saprospiraceae bacterium]